MASIRHPLFARFYSRLVVPMMRRSGADAHRERLVSGLSGTVVEVGCGPGDNFALYPSEVTSVVAVEPEPFLRARAGEAAAAATGEPGRVGVVEGTADALPVADGSADAVVFSLVLCSVHDVPAALAEARRVLRPGGEIRVLEHVAAPDSPRMRRVQHALDATLWPRMFGGCHTGRDTAAAVTDAGFAWTEMERFVFPEGARGPEAHSIIGRATVAV